MILRDFADVLTSTIAEVPAEEAELRRRLTKVLDDVGFQPPEARWQHLGWKIEAIFESTFKDVPAEDLATGWRAKAVAVWMGTEAPG